MRRPKRKPPVQMSAGEAQALRVRCSETLLPYVESKTPVAVDLDPPGDFSLIIPGAAAVSERAQLIAAIDEVLPLAEQAVAAVEALRAKCDFTEIEKIARRLKMREELAALDAGLDPEASKVGPYYSISLLVATAGAMFSFKPHEMHLIISIRDELIKMRANLIAASGAS